MYHQTQGLVTERLP